MILLNLLLYIFLSLFFYEGNNKVYKILILINKIAYNKNTCI